MVDKKKQRCTYAIISAIAVCMLICLISILSSQNNKQNEQNILNTSSEDTQEFIPEIQTPQEEPVVTYYTVESVTDGDTFRINYNGTSTPVRIIGVNTPETVDPRTTVECFGKEASDYLKSKLTGKKVSLEADPTQSDRDKYDRLLRYVYLEGGEDVGLSIISDGYGYEYTYNTPYQKQSEYKAAQNTASVNNKGLWSPSTCSGNKTTPTKPTPTTPSTECNIKGNISNKGEKIYHMPGQKYYDATKIDTSKGERYFCTEQEAINAGWRKAKV